MGEWGLELLTFDENLGRFPAPSLFERFERMTAKEKRVCQKLVDAAKAAEIRASSVIALQGKVVPVYAEGSAEMQIIKDGQNDLAKHIKKVQSLIDGEEVIEE